MNFDGMNFEDAEIMLTAVNMMHEANLKIMSPEEAEAEHKSNMEKLVRTWRALNPEMASDLPVEVEARLSLCHSCKDHKPLIFFNTDTDSDHRQLECMDCVAEKLWRENRPSQEAREKKPGNKVTRKMVVDAARRYETGFTKDGLAYNLAYGRDFLPEDIDLSVRSHIRRLIGDGELSVSGKRTSHGVGRPKTLYQLTSLGVPEELVKEE